MMQPVELTVRVDQYQPDDGPIIYTASLEELPGVVAEGESEEAAISELMALAEDVSRRLGSDVVGFRTPFVRAWSWFIGGAGQTPETYGAVLRTGDLQPELAVA